MKYLMIYAMLICSLAVVASSSHHDTYKVHVFKAYNGIRFQYGLLLPADYDRSKSYEIVAVLSEVHINDKAWEKSMKRLEAIDLERTILIVPQVPVGKESWGTHPIHHAFNDLLKSVRKSHGKASQKFHLIGLEAGQETAFWWTSGSKDIIASTSVINGHLWKETRWDQKWYNNLVRSEVPIFVYENQPVDKFDMPKFKFQQMTTIAEVVRDIEQRSW